MGIKINHVFYTYQKKATNATLALNDVSFEIEDNDFISIVGETGSGKSTLAQTFNALIFPDEGEVQTGDYVISYKNRKSRSLKGLRKHVGLVFQFPEYQLFEETVEKDVAFGLKNYGYKEVEAIKLAHKALEEVGIDKSFYKRSPFELSGGEKRRVAIAGIIALNPDILVLDEPTAGLDPKGSKIILNLINKFNKEGKTIILVTHDMNIVLNYSDHVVVMNDGKVAFEGTPSDLFSGDISTYSIDVPELFKFVKLLESKGMKLDISKIRTIDDLISQLKEKR